MPGSQYLFSWVKQQPTTQKSQKTDICSPEHPLITVKMKGDVDGHFNAPNTTSLSSNNALMGFAYPKFLWG